LGIIPASSDLSYGAAAAAAAARESCRIGARQVFAMILSVQIVVSVIYLIGKITCPN
jgi:hypothetical protein